MKLIALKDFANVPALGLNVDDKKHDGHIHRGAIFEIGNGKSLTDKAMSVPDRQLVAQLTVSGCVGDATDSKVVQAVREQIALDKKREENAAKLNAAAGGSALIEQLTALFKNAAEATGDDGKKK